MLTINGKKYAKNEKEFINSLFESGGTCYGYYKQVKSGVKLLDHNKNIFAFIVNNRYNEQFFVSAHVLNGKTYYMNSTTSVDDKILGLDILGYSAKTELAKNIIAGLNN